MLYDWCKRIRYHLAIAHVSFVNLNLVLLFCFMHLQMIEDNVLLVIR